MKDDRKRERAVALLVKEARDQHQTLRETIDVKNQDFLVVVNLFTLK